MFNIKNSTRIIRSELREKEELCSVFLRMYEQRNFEASVFFFASPRDAIEVRSEKINEKK